MLAGRRDREDRRRPCRNDRIERANDREDAKIADVKSCAAVIRWRQAPFFGLVAQSDPVFAQLG